MLARTWRSGAWRSALLFAACAASLSCGGNNLGAAAPPSPGPASNVVAVVVDGGPEGSAINTLYTTVTVCLPGSTTSCQTIDHIQVDTMSYGLRLLAPVLSLTFPVTSASNGASLVECIPFADGYSWGPVALADVAIAGESASQVPVQLIGDTRFPTVPADCASSGPTPEDTVQAFGANGLLGIGPFAQDCPQCANTVEPATYYACTGSACQGTTVALTRQVTNPITFFATDNNGSIIALSSVAAAGAASVSGKLIFGIDTESNNQLGTMSVFTLDSVGELTTTYMGQTLTSSFIDSGSNGYFFADSTLAPCTEPSFQGFYCPASPVTRQGTLQGQNGVSAGVSFTVSDIEAAVNAEPTFAAFPRVGGTNVFAGSFDWGLPFFYGRPVAIAIAGATTSTGGVPFVAF